MLQQKGCILMYQLDNGTVGYTWKKTFICPYESLWGIIEKFKYLNAMDSINCKGFMLKHMQSYNIVANNQLRIYNYGVKYKNDDLLDFLQISSETHFEVLKKFIWNDLNEYMDRKVRICPICIAKGYHSYIHQLFWEDTCFLHPDKKLMETNTDYIFEYSSNDQFRKDTVITTYIEPAMDILQYLLEQKNNIPCTKGIWGDDVVHLGIIYMNTLLSNNNALFNVKTCLKSIFHNSKLFGGAVVWNMTKTEASKQWTKYGYYDESEKYGSDQTRWFSDYCYLYAKKLVDTCDKTLFDDTLRNFYSSVSAAAIRNYYFDYNHYIIAVIITGIILTGYTDIVDIPYIFSERWHIKKRACFYENLYANYVRKSRYAYQKTAFIELYKRLVKDLYDNIQKKAQSGFYANKTYREINYNMDLPMYLVVETTEKVKIIRIND